MFLGILGSAPSASCWARRRRTGSRSRSARSSPRTGPASASLLPIGRFRIYTVTGEPPARARADYKLKVNGLVDQPFELSYAELRAMPPTKLTRDFQCVTGWRVPDVEWKGVRLADLLDRAGVQPEATAMRFKSFDGTYTESLTLAQARRKDVIVAYKLEGAPSPTSTAARCASTSRRCTATSRSSGSTRSSSPTEVEAGLLGGPRLRRRRMGRAVEWRDDDAT